MRVGDEVSTEVHPVNGGPQGSVLIMFCWLLYVDDLPGVVKHCGVSLFMDDVALWVAHPDPKEAVRLLNVDLAAIYNRSIFNTVCFDASKFHLLDMGKEQLPQDLMDSVLFGTEQPMVSKSRFPRCYIRYES